MTFLLEHHAELGRNGSFLLALLNRASVISTSWLSMIEVRKLAQSCHFYFISVVRKSVSFGWPHVISPVEHELLYDQSKVSSIGRRCNTLSALRIDAVFQKALLGTRNAFCKPAQNARLIFIHCQPSPYFTGTHRP
jgi:hypothetical protein